MIGAANVMPALPTLRERPHGFVDTGDAERGERGPGQAAGYLQQALTIYQRLGVPGARHVRLAFHRQACVYHCRTPSERFAERTPRPAAQVAHQPGGRSANVTIVSPGCYWHWVFG
jgi:hypothetical protein